MKRRVAALVMALVFCVSSMSVTAAETTESPTQTETNKAEEEVVSEEKETEEETEQTPTDPVEETKDEEGKEEETTAQGETSAQEEGQEEVVAEGAIMATAVALGEDSAMVAKIGETEYPSLQAAVAAAEKSNNSTLEKSTEIVLLKDTNDGLDIGNSSGTEAQNIIINLNGHTLTLGPAIGSTGTETNGLRVLAYSKLEVKNGTVVCSNLPNDKGSNVKVGMANYGTLTLTDVDFQSGDYVLYTINNRGALTLSGTTKVESGKADSQIAITNDPYNYYYTNFDASLTIDSESVSIGKVQLERYGNSQNKDAKVVLNISAGAIGEIVEDGKTVVSVQSNITGGIFKNDPTKYVSDEYTVITNADGTYTVSEKKVAQIGETTYTSLKKAIEAANSGETVKLLTDANVKETIRVDDSRSISFDLNGKNVTAKENVDQLFLVSEGSLKVTGKGKLEAEGDVFRLEGNITGLSQDREAKTAEVYIDKEVEVISTENCCVYIIGKGAKADVYGKLRSQGAYATIQGNGSYLESNNRGDTVINIYPGASVVQERGMAIYHPQYGTLNITGGTIEGETTGIEIRAGKLTVTGGTIAGKGEPTEVTPNGNGSTSDGVGIAIAQHTTKLPIDVTINGGTISGYSALYESNPQNNDADALAKITINIKDGYFSGRNLDIYSEDKTDFISGGHYVHKPASAYIVADKASILETVKKDGITYLYTIGTPEAVDKVVSPAAPEAGAKEGVDTTNVAVKDIITEKKDKIEFQATLSEAAEEVQNITDTQVEDALNKLNDVLPADSQVQTDDMTIHIRPFLDMQIKEVKDDISEKRLTLDIKMMYQMVAATTDDASDIKTTGDAQNAVELLDEPEELTVEKGTPVTITIPLPDSWENNALMVRHKKEDGTVYFYKPTYNNADKTITFVNPNGFSEFSILLDARTTTIAYEGITNPVTYTATDVNTTAHPTLSRSGYIFRGWRITGEGVVSGLLSDALLTSLNGQNISATPVFEAIPTSTGSGSSSSSSSSHSSSSVKTVTAAKTGDTTNVWTPMLMMLAALAVSGGCVVYSRKKKQAEQ